MRARYSRSAWMSPLTVDAVGRVRRRGGDGVRRPVRADQRGLDRLRAVGELAHPGERHPRMARWTRRSWRRPPRRRPRSIPTHAARASGRRRRRRPEAARRRSDDQDLVRRHARSGTARRRTRRRDDPLAAGRAQHERVVKREHAAPACPMPDRHARWTRRPCPGCGPGDRRSPAIVSRAEVELGRLEDAPHTSSAPRARSRRPASAGALELLEPADVDEVLGTGQPQLDQRQQALAAREDLGGATGGREGAERLSRVAGRW